MYWPQQLTCVLETCKVQHICPQKVLKKESALVMGLYQDTKGLKYVMKSSSTDTS